MTHGRVNLRILTQRGVRQGCVFSPLLWSCFTCYVAKRLPQTLRKQDLQMYADDFLMYWIFRCRVDFHRALSSIPILLGALRAFGLNINLSKTAVLVRQPEFVPLVKQHKYLGCIISLFDFEVRTLRHRISVGRSQFTRLRKVLTSRKHLTLSRRARIWDACIWSSLSYGLICCGFTGYSYSKLAEVVATQLRAVARSPRHIHHETNEALRARLHIQDPAQRLQQLHHGLVQRLLSGCQHLPEHDIMRNPDFLEQARYVSQLLAEAKDYHPCFIPLKPQTGVPCPECGLYFVDESAVRKHLAVKHPDLHTAEPIDMDSINRNVISIDGMPVCSGCRVNFCSWQKLLQHVRYRRCPGLRYDTSEGVVPIGVCSTNDTHQNASEDRPCSPQAEAACVAEDAVSDPTITVKNTGVAALPLLKRRGLVQAWVSEGARRCIRDLTNVDLSRECREHCCICRQWIADTRHMKQHIKQSHPHVYAKYHQQLVADCAALSGTVLASQPCPVIAVQPPSLSDMRRCAPYFIRSPWCVALMSGMGTTSAEQEITSLFAPYLPSLSTAAPLGKRQGAPARRDPPKHRRPESKGASGALGKGKGKGSRGGGSSQPGSASNQSPIPNLQEEEGIKEVIRMLMQVSIRHEDHINLLRLQDRSFLLWMKTSSPESMLPTIVAASKAWKEKREAGTTDTSLRVTLFRCLLVELKNRATQMVENSELRAKLMTAGWLQVKEGQEPMWNPMMWSRTEERRR